eukprot:TRINITY_DN1103_c0_g1_i1.p1 TRINITY_DN1103_c0_g1~~TRINITY_DN1103_c0_g1_i1.p1  ORF type:complete len:607 (-),score=152.73 TRINITY_DN1103_c0_g1_i1:93-1913(-)
MEDLSPQQGQKKRKRSEDNSDGPSRNKRPRTKSNDNLRNNSTDLKSSKSDGNIPNATPQSSKFPKQNPRKSVTRDTPMTREEKKYKRKITQNKRKYQRGAPVDIDSIQHKPLQSKLKHEEQIIREGIESAARSEMLLTEEQGYLTVGDGRKTYEVTQEEIKESVDLVSANKIFDLELDTFGPYVFKYTPNGRFLILGGKKGHVGVIDWQKNKLLTEMHLKETVRDVTFLQNETMFAVAQKEYIGIYDKKSTELHRLTKHVHPNRLDYLPYHFLLVSVCRDRNLRYVDVSTGSHVVTIPAPSPQCHALTHNPTNGVVHLGDSIGTVSLWSPNQTKPLIKMLCHQGAIKDIQVSLNGRYMATSGLDSVVKIWDLRTYQVVNEFHPKNIVTSLSISQPNNMLAMSFGSVVEVYKQYDIPNEKDKKPVDKLYLTKSFPSSTQVTRIGFCPYEDVLGISHNVGFSSMVVPGSGIANIDSYVANPFQTKKQRREQTIVDLLDKLPPESIQLDPNRIGKIRDDHFTQLEEKQKISSVANSGKTPQIKNKMRGKNKTGRREARKQVKILKDKQKSMDDAKQYEKEKERVTKLQKAKEIPDQPTAALDRFKSKQV